MKNNNLFKIQKDGETHYFTTLNKAARFIGTQRNVIDYAYLKKKQYNGWTIENIDGQHIEWGKING